MSTPTSNSVETVLSDLADIEQTLTDDSSGERACAMHTYFEQAAAASEQRLAGMAVDDAQRLLARHLAEGFRAAARVVRQVWETLHTASLPA